MATAAAAESWWCLLNKSEMKMMVMMRVVVQPETHVVTVILHMVLEQQIQLLGQP